MLGELPNGYRHCHPNHMLLLLLADEKRNEGK